MLLLEIEQKIKPFSWSDKETLFKFLTQELASEPSAAPAWLQLEGSCRGMLSTVDEFIQRKAEEKRLER